MNPDRALRRLRLEPVGRIPQREHLSHPELLRLMSGLDPYQSPRQADLTEINHFLCHDDTCMARGAACSPAWLREFIYPYYEEFFGYMRDVGIIVIFMTDGNPDLIADDVFACGADALISEPFGDYRKIARKHPDKMLAGERGNRVLMTGDRDAVEAVTRRMCELGRRPQPGGVAQCTRMPSQ